MLSVRFGCRVWLQILGGMGSFSCGSEQASPLWVPTAAPAPGTYTGGGTQLSHPVTFGSWSHGTPSGKCACSTHPGWKGTNDVTTEATWTACSGATKIARALCLWWPRCLLTLLFSCWTSTHKSKYFQREREEIHWERTPERFFLSNQVWS